MRRFIITSPAFTGQAELVYDSENILVKIDVSNTNMRTLVFRFKNMVPTLADDIATAFAPTRATVIEADFEVTYEMFWSKYNKKINNKRCIALWGKLTKTKQVKAFYGVDAYDKYLSKESWRSKADPETYLRNEMWENEWK